MNGDGSGSSTHSTGSYRVSGCANGGRADSDLGNVLEPPYMNCDAGGLVTVNGVGSGRVRHLNGQVFAFADGHVKWYKGNQGVTSFQVSHNKIYDMYTGFNTSKENPTFNATSRVDF